MKTAKRLPALIFFPLLLTAMAFGQGTVVFGGLGPGLGSTVNPFDPNYQQLQLRANQQAMADKINATAAANYQARAKQLKEANVQQQATGQPLFTLDPPPHKKVLDASNNMVDSPEPVTPPLSVVPDPPTAPGSPTAIPTDANAPPDRMDRLTQMVIVLKADLEAIKARLGVQ